MWVPFLRSIQRHDLLSSLRRGLRLLRQGRENFSYISIFLFSIQLLIIASIFLITDRDFTLRFNNDLSFSRNVLIGIIGYIGEYIIVRTLRSALQYLLIIELIIQWNRDIEKLMLRYHSLIIRIKKKMILYFLLQLIIGVYIVYHFSLSFIIYRHTMTLLWLRIVISICTALLISILISIFTAIIEMCCSLTDNTNIYSSFLLYCKALIL